MIKKKIPPLTLLDKSGKNKLFDFKRADGRYTLLEFWFTGCTGCIPAMQYLKQHYDDLSKKVQIITICTDAQMMTDAVRMLEKLDLPWKNYWDFQAKQLGKFVNLYIYPRNLLIDSEGYKVSEGINTSEIFGFISP